MACNCEGKQYNVSMGCCEPVLAPIQNYYTKYKIDKMIESATTSGCCITPEEVESAITSAITYVEGEIPSLSGYATEQWVLDKHYISGVDLSDYALKSEIPTVPTSNTAFTNDAGYLTEHQPLKTINGETLVGEGNIVITGSSVVIDPSLDSGSTNPVSNSAITEAVMVDSATTVDTTGYTRYYPSQNEHATYETGSDNLVIYDYWKNRSHLYKATIELIDSEGNTISGSVSVGDGVVLSPSNVVPSALASYLTATIDSTSPFVIAYQTVDGYKISWANIYDYDDEWERYMDLSLKTVETVNEPHTASDVIENYILPALDGKQDKLSAGTNVSIYNNVISATDTTYLSGDGISITNNVISTTTQFACVSEAEWEIISGNPQSNTVYLIY